MDIPTSETDAINAELEMAATNLLLENAALKQDKRYLKQALIMADRSVQLALQVRPDHPGVNKMMANIDKTIADIRLSMAFDGTQEEVNL